MERPFRRCALLRILDRPAELTPGLASSSYRMAASMRSHGWAPSSTAPILPGLACYRVTSKRLAVSPARRSATAPPRALFRRAPRLEPRSRLTDSICVIWFISRPTGPHLVARALVGKHGVCRPNGSSARSARYLSNPAIDQRGTQPASGACHCHR